MLMRVDPVPYVFGRAQMTDEQHPPAPPAEQLMPAEIGKPELRQASLLVGLGAGDGNDDPDSRELMLRSETGLTVTMSYDEALQAMKQIVDQLASNQDTIQVYVRGLLEVEKRDDLPDVEPVDGGPDPLDWRDNPDALVPLALAQVEPGLWVFEHNNPEDPPMQIRRLMFLQPDAASMLQEFTVAGRPLIRQVPVLMATMVGGVHPWFGARFSDPRLEPGELVRVRCSGYTGHVMLLVSAAPSKDVVKPEELL